MASLLAGLGTGVGALGIFLVRKLPGSLEDSLLSAAAGVMLAASFFSLLLPGIEYGETLTGETWSATLVVIAGLLMGSVGLYLIHQCFPHEHFKLGREGPDPARVRRIWLFVIAIGLHNFPEGMAVGVGFAGGNIGNGLALAIGIGLQNILEGGCRRLASGHSAFQTQGLQHFAAHRAGGTPRRPVRCHHGLVGRALNALDPGFRGGRHAIYHQR